ncbi:MAG TPA: hypothetical protein H9915_11670 [Candidatus Gemmiger faecigallinarum]|nr:hypothetical protein [Candidatus Gemmiger faecigallinarum]
MANIDIAAFMEQCGIRKARFGGLEPDDVRQAMLALSSEYEKRLSRAEDRARQLQQENAGLEKHCQSLTARNRVLTDQNVTLAGSSDNYSRQRQELSGQVSSLREKNRSLADQNAVYVLKNADLVRENQRLKKDAEEARAALTVKGRALDEEKSALDADRQNRMDQAKADADAIVQEARKRAGEMVQKAQGEVDAIHRAARDQARQQAQALVDAAAAEANEIQNIHQLRLNSLKGEIADMDARRTELVEYLKHMADVLLNAEQEARDKAPAPMEGAADEPPAELEPVEAPEVRLDLSETAIARAAAELAAETPPEPETTPVDPSHVEPAGEPLPYPDEKSAARHSFTLVSEGDDGFAPAPADFERPVHEVPGAIFSQPIVRRQVQEPVVDEAPPTADPRRPVLPSLDDDEEDEPAAPAGQETPSAARAADPRAERRRALALHAMRALRRRSAGAQ